MSSMSDCEMTPTVLKFEGLKKSVAKLPRLPSRNLDDIEESGSLKSADVIELNSTNFEYETDKLMDRLSLNCSSESNWFFVKDFLKGFRDPQIESV